MKSGIPCWQATSLYNTLKSGNPFIKDAVSISSNAYRSKIMRFTFQLSLGDGEVRDWFEQQPEKGAYLKDLILRDKAERLGYREQESAEPDKAGDYEIIQSIRMGGRVLLMGFNPKDETYMTCYQQYNFLGETMYPEALACKSYLEIAETFLNRLQAQVEKVKAFRAARNVPYAVLGAEACLPPSEESLQGKLIVLRPTSLAPEYRTADCQLGFALSGFGCTPGARGRAVYFEELYSGERCRWDASDILGVANPEKIPDWAKEKLREYEQKRTEPKKDRGEAR